MENRIWEILAASIHGEELSQEEISTLQVWLDENKQNRDEYARLQIFYAENKGSLTDNINVQRAWEDNYARRKLYVGDMRLSLHWLLVLVCYY